MSTKNVINKRVSVFESLRYLLTLKSLLNVDITNIPLDFVQSAWTSILRITAFVYLS